MLQDGETISGLTRELWKKEIKKRTKKNKEQTMIVVTYWAGTTQKTKIVKSYAAAQKLIDKEHRNSHDPIFATEDGETLIDTGSYFVTQKEAAKKNPVVYA